MTIYLHEIIHTVPGREETYMASVLSVVEAPGRIQDGVRDGQLGQWRSIETSGVWPKVINIWQHPGWHTLFDNLSRQFTDVHRDAEMEDWWISNTDLRTGGFDRVLLPTDYTKDVRGLVQSGVKGGVFLHEILRVPMGEVDTYLNKLGDSFLKPAESFGWQVVGAYSVAWRPKEVLTIFAMEDWARFSSLQAAREKDQGLKQWFEYRDRTVERCDEMLLLPARTNPMFA